MADTKRGRLGVALLVKETNTLAYEVTSAMDANVDIIITNKGNSTAEVRIAVVDGGLVDLAAEDYILYNMKLAQNASYTIEDIDMNADEAIVAYASKAGVVVRVEGIEEDESGSSVLPSMQKISSGALTVADFTDNTDTTGYVDLATDLPAGAIPVGWKAIATGAFTGDTSAVLQVGIDGDLDRFSAVTDQSIFAAGTVASAGVAADGGDGVAAAQTIRVTVTSATDFGLVVTDATGAMSLELYYIATV